MKKWNMISLILIASLLPLAAFAADPDPQPVQDVQQAEMTEEQQEAQEEAMEAQRGPSQGPSRASPWTQ